MSLLEQITARRAELAELAHHLAKQLADVEHELDRVSVAEQVVTQMLATQEPTDPDPAQQAPVTPTTPPTPTGALIIPYRHQTTGIDELPADYQLLLQTVTQAGGPLICKRICQTVGLSTESGSVEGTRAKLNRLAERGRLRKTPAGAFAPRP